MDRRIANCFTIGDPERARQVRRAVLANTWLLSEALAKLHARDVGVELKALKACYTNTGKGFAREAVGKRPAGADRKDAATPHGGRAGEGAPPNASPPIRQAITPPVASPAQFFRGESHDARSCVRSHQAVGVHIGVLTSPRREASLLTSPEAVQPASGVFCLGSVLGSRADLLTKSPGPAAQADHRGVHDLVLTALGYRHRNLHVGNPTFPPFGANPHSSQGTVVALTTRILQGPQQVSGEAAA